MRHYIAALLLTVSLSFSSAGAKTVHYSENDFNESSKSLYQLISKGSYKQADRFLRDIYSHNASGLYGDRLYAIISDVTNTKDPMFLSHLNSWIQADGTSAFAYLTRATFYFGTGEQARGSDFIKKVGISDKLRFSDAEDLAWKDVQQSLSLDDAIAYSHMLAYDIAMNIKGTATKDAVFARGGAKFPGYLNLYLERLRSLAPKWGGSVNQEITFALRYSANVPKDSAFKILPLSLYSHLTTDFDIDCEYNNNVSARENCKRSTMDFLKSDIMHAKLKEAFGLYKEYTDEEDKYEFNTNNIINVLGCKCIVFKPPADNLFAVAYEVLGNDNYALNYSFGLYHTYNARAQAIANFKKALVDIEAFHFPSPEKKNGMLALVYDNLADTYNYSGQYKDALEYANKAIALYPEAADFLLHRCTSYTYLKQYDAAIAECNAAIRLNDKSFQAWYDEGLAYFSLQKYAQAAHAYEKAKSLEADMTQETKDILNVALAHAYYKANDYKKIIEFYNGLYKENPGWFSIGSPYAAAAYETLCYAHMGLEEYQQALEDCNKSISIADMGPASAYKRQILEKMHFTNKE